nr:hypothetical protein [Tanacetum cinerariifolium]
MFNPQEFFLPEELLPPKKRGRNPSSSSTSALPQEFEIEESSHKTKSSLQVRLIIPTPLGYPFDEVYLHKNVSQKDINICSTGHDSGCHQ